MVKVKYISLVNLIMDRLVVKEIIQHEMTASNLEKELKQLLFDQERIEQLKKDYEALRKALGEGGNASAKAAESIISFLRQGA